MNLKKISISLIIACVAFLNPLKAFPDQQTNQHCNIGDVCWWGGVVANEDCDLIYGERDSSSAFRLKSIYIKNDSVWFTGYYIRACSDSLFVCTSVRNDTITVKMEPMGTIYRCACHYGYHVVAVNCTLASYHVVFLRATNAVINGAFFDTLVNMPTSSETHKRTSNVDDGIILRGTPNPFQSSISFEVFGEHLVKDRTLTIYDVAGTRIAVLSGTNRFVWERGVYPSGAYIAVLRDRQGKAIVSKRFLSL